MSDNEFYFDENNKPKLYPSYCAFLDILGFSQKIEADSSGELLQQFYSSFVYLVNKIEEDTRKTTFFYKVFSDNLLLAHPKISDDLESEFAFILWSIQEYQYEMAKNGLFIRGGFDFDNLFFTNETVYGKALLTAYSLETRKAINPIVVLSDSVKRLVNRHIRYYSAGEAPQIQSILKNQDEQYFVNYLEESIDENDVDVDGLLMHKGKIENELSLNKKNLNVYNKFLWLASYHNYFCNSINNLLDQTTLDSLVIENISSIYTISRIDENL